jgi:hypothetical protein
MFLRRQASIRETSDTGRSKVIGDVASRLRVAMSQEWVAAGIVEKGMAAAARQQKIDNLEAPVFS